MLKNHQLRVMQTAHCPKLVQRIELHCQALIVICLTKTHSISSGNIFLTMSAISFLTFGRKTNSSSLFSSKWSSIERLFRPVMNINVSKPAVIASSTAYCISSLSMSSKSSLDVALVAGKSLEARPATGKTAFYTLDLILMDLLLEK